VTDFRVNVIVDPARAKTGAKQVKNSLDQVGDAANRTRNLIRKAFTLGAVTALTGSIAVLTGQAIRFNTAMAEVSTLTVGTEFNMRALESAVLDQSAAFGSLPAAQAAAAYDIISAGASSAAEAVETLEAANRLAIGGVTDVSTAADGLTSVLNAYGDGVKSAADVSDILFVGVRQGKTTIAELSASIGKVEPLAANAGVGFDELTASVAALTAGGISTRESVTGVRAILASVVKPTQEAREAAKRLGIDFSTAAIQSQGFEGFLQNVVDKTGGSTDEIAQLFGGVEALIPVLALSGEAGEKFAETMELMGDRAGATQAAFDLMANSPGFQIGRITSGITAEFTRLSSVILKAIVPALKFLADSTDEIVRIIGVAAGVLAVQLARKAIPLAIAGVRALTAVMATNPLGAIVTGASLAIGALIAFSDRLNLTGEGAASVFDFIVVVFNDFKSALFAGFEFIFGLFGDFQVNADSLDIGVMVRNFATGLDRIRAYFIASFEAIENIVINATNRIGQIVSDTLNGLVGFGQDFVTGLNVISRTITGQEITADVVADFGVNFEPRFQATGRTAGEAFNEALGQSLTESPVLDYVNGALDRAEARAASRADVMIEGSKAVLEVEEQVASAIQATTDAADKGAVNRTAIIDREISNLEAEITALGLVGDERSALLGKLALEEQIRSALRESNDELTEAQLNNMAKLSAAEEARFVQVQKSLDQAQRRAALEDQLNGSTRALSQTQTAAAELFGAGTITIGQYNQLLRDTLVAQRELAIDAGQGTFADGFILSIDRISNRMQSWRSEVGTSFGELFSTLGSGFADAIGQGVFEMDNLGESIKSVARDAVSQLISSLIQVGVQQVANFALQQTLGASATAAGIGQAGALAAAYAPAAAAASLATAGGNAAPAGIGIGTIFALVGGLVGGLAIAGFRDGTDSVGGSGSSISDSVLAKLSVGEGVVTARANKRNAGVVGFMNNGGNVGDLASNNRPVNVNFNFPNGDADSFKRNRRQIVRDTQKALEAI